MKAKEWLPRVPSKEAVWEYMGSNRIGNASLSIEDLLGTTFVDSFHPAFSYSAFLRRVHEGTFDAKVSFRII